MTAEVAVKYRWKQMQVLRLIDKLPTRQAKHVGRAPIGDEYPIHLAVPDEGLLVHLSLSVLPGIKEPG